MALFSYVKSNEKTTGPREWTVAQMEEIQLHAMNALATLGPILIDDYMTCQGGTRLLLLLEWCTGRHTMSDINASRNLHCIQQYFCLDKGDDYYSDDDCDELNANFSFVFQVLTISKAKETASLVVGDAATRELK